MSGNRVYQKPYLSPRQLVQHLKQRGLIVPDPSKAEQFLLRHSYYRFKGYAYVFRVHKQKSSPFKVETSFDDVVALMNFDRDLRVLLMRAFDHLEVSIRACINESLTQKYNTPFWYQDSSLFFDESKHSSFIDGCEKEFKRSHDLFAQHYKQNYDHPSLPPGWILFEIASFGTWSRIISLLKSKEDQKNISNSVGCQFVILKSWLHGMVYLRNICAHHGRVWNRVFGIKPKIPRRLSPSLIVEGRHPVFASSDRFSMMFYVVHSLLKKLDVESGWSQQMMDLIRSRSDYNQYQMGFSKNWFEHEVWK